MGDFENDTRVRGGDGRYRATLSQDWEIWGPNGGYLAATALRAVGAEAAIPRPSSYHGHFLSVAKFGDVDLEVAPIRVGRSSESFRVSVTQAGKPVFEGMVRTAAPGPGLEHAHGAAPDVPPAEALRDWQQIDADEGREAAGPRFPFWNNIECRPSVVVPLEQRMAPAAPELAEWFRFRPSATFDDPWVDAGRSVVLIDTLSWPAAYRPHRPTEWTAPNLDVMVWFHRPAPDAEWLLAEHVSPVAHGGLMGTLGRVWSPDGGLVATGGAQLFCLPPRPAS